MHIHLYVMIDQYGIIKYKILIKTTITSETVFENIMEYIVKMSYECAS